LYDNAHSVVAAAGVGVGLTNDECLADEDNNKNNKKNI
jgi:hypothetical protein